MDNLKYLERLEELQKKENRLFKKWMRCEMSNSEYDRAVEPIRKEMNECFEVLLKRA